MYLVAGSECDFNHIVTLQAFGYDQIKLEQILFLYIKRGADT